MADTTAPAAPVFNSEPMAAPQTSQGAPQATNSMFGAGHPPKPTVEDEPAGDKPTDTAASIPAPSVKPDLPPTEAVPKPPMTDLNGDTKMGEPEAPKPQGDNLMAGALQDGPPKPAGTDIVAPVPVKEDSLVTDIAKGDAPVVSKPVEDKPTVEKSIENKSAEQLPERPQAPGPEAAKEPVQDPAKDAFKPEMGANVNGQKDTEKLDKTESIGSLPAATTAAPASVPAPVAEKPTTEAAEEAKLDAMPALAAEPPAVGTKRAADQAEPHTGLNGGAAAPKEDGPPAKKAKVAESGQEDKPAEPAAKNGGLKKSISRAKSAVKKALPPVGKTARKTRSQGPIEG